MAAPIVVSARIETSPEKIFAALTESAGLASFWIEDSEGQPILGSVTKMNLPSGSTLKLSVDDLQPGRRVVWKPITEFSRPPSWLGTTVSWDLRAMGEATEVLFQHAGWPADLPQTALAQLTFLWAQVMASLRAFAESGVPKPIISSASARPSPTS
jgi:uncharacterized protein YndB with AHSA1/START domain